MNLNKKINLLLIVLLTIAFSENRVRIMTYNLENYGGDGYDYKTETSRNSDYRTIINEIDPDIIIAQEVYGAHEADTRFMNDVLNYEQNIWGSLFIDQKTDNGSTDVWQDIGVFYKNQKFRPVSKKEIEIAGGYLRDAIEVKLEDQQSKTIITIYGVHLKAGKTDQEERENQAKKLRAYLNTLSENTPFIIAGDFNIYKSSEGAWQRLTEEQQDNNGRVFDPIERIGAWNNNASFADVHTQSSRKSSGGMDDRFDFILISKGIREHNRIEYIPGSYSAYGNDGNHFNISIDWQTNSVVSATIADALYNASDHLPVFADFDFTGIVSFDNNDIVSQHFSLEQNYPNPFNPTTNIEFNLAQKSMISLQIHNLNGQLVKTLIQGEYAAGNYRITWNRLNQNNQPIPNGIYIHTLTNQMGNKISKKMILVK